MKEIEDMLKDQFVPEGTAERAMNRLSMAITQNAARLKKRRQEKRQAYAFALAALMLLAAGIAAVTIKAFDAEKLMYAVGAGAGLTGLMAPVMIYLSKEEAKHDG